MSEKPVEPPEQHLTARQALRETLGADPRSARELSALLSMTEKEVIEHLEHLGRSLEAEGKRLIVLAARCVKCGYEFHSRERLRRPGRCPECKSERVQPPRFFLG